MQLTYISATIAVAIALLCAWYCRRLAFEKGRNVVLWTLLGLILTVIAVPVLVLLPGPDHGVGGVSSGGAEDPPSPDGDGTVRPDGAV